MVIMFEFYNLELLFVLFVKNDKQTDWKNDTQKNVWFVIYIIVLLLTWLFAMQGL